MEDEPIGVGRNGKREQLLRKAQKIPGLRNLSSASLNLVLSNFAGTLFARTAGDVDEAFDL
jgi:hypothetical protein